MSEAVQAALVRARDVLARADAVRREAERATVRWEFVTEGAAEHRPEPLVRLRGFGPKQVKRYSERPSPPARTEAYGSDDAGRIVWCRTGERLEHDEYLRVVADGVESVSFHEGRAASGAFTPIETGVVVCTASVSADGRKAFEAFSYGPDGRLELVRDRMELTTGLETLPIESETRLHYDQSGRLVEIVKESMRGGEEVVYRATGRGPTRARAAADAEDELVRAVRRFVSQHAPAEPVTALLLQYDLEDPLPPAPAFVTDAAWRRLMAGDRPLYRLWNPAEQPSFQGRALTSPELVVLAGELRLLDDSGELARGALQSACRRLNEEPWPDSFLRTDDFVATCVDLELEHVEKDLAAVADAGLVTRIDEAGLLRRS